MKKENIIAEKSYSFALTIVKIFRHLTEEKKEYVLSRQLLKSGTSIGANIEEAIGVQSTKDFYAKLTISYKEARETDIGSDFCETAISLALPWQMPY
ncbi:MAG: four helix bundle protein [Cytophagaceae bacterium]